MAGNVPEGGPEALARVVPFQGTLAVPDLDSRTQSLCSSSHVLPPPDVEPRFLWPAKIEQMYGYMTSPQPEKTACQTPPCLARRPRCL